jgi:hypothetical protein
MQVAKQEKLDAAAAAAAAYLKVPETEEEDAKYMKISLRRGIDLDKVRKSHKKIRYGRGKKDRENITPFEQDLSSTGSITTLKADGIGEVGALSLAAEFARGACPMLETLDMKGCCIRSEGMGRLLKGVKMANLATLRVLNLRGNFLGPFSIAYLKDVCQSGVLMNLQVLVLSDNEIGDDGVDFLVQIIMEGHFVNMCEIYLEHNSITDWGFNKIVTKLKSVQQAKCPLLQRLSLSNNLVSAKEKRKLSPLPYYVSV